MSELKEKPMDHQYDGIQEYDNPLPGWWLGTFYITIVFTVLYIGYYHVGSGPSPEQELSADLTSIKESAAQNAPKEPPVTEEALAAVFASADRKAAGKVIFTEKCASCHAPDGGGIIGPNLTDNYWIHGQGTMVDMLKVVNEGVADKGMPPWGAILKKDELQSVVAFVKSLHGTKPATPKAPQGNEVKGGA